MARTGEENHVEVVFLDLAREVGINEGQTGTGAPVTQETILNVLGLERFTEQRIVLKIEHTEDEVRASSPEGVGLLKFLGT
jgi:hypothetical protein